MRRVLGHVEAGRLVEDAGIRLDDLLDLIGRDMEDEEELLDGLVNNFTTAQLEQIAAAVPSESHPPPPSSAPKRKKRKSTPRVSIVTKHSNAYKRVRQMR